MDFERVYASDMKKMVKWFGILKANDLLKFEEILAEGEEEVEEEKKVEEVPVEEAPKEPEDKDKDPETILDDIFDLGQGLEKEKLTKDRFKMIGELKHYKRKKKNRTV